MFILVVFGRSSFKLFLNACKFCSYLNSKQKLFVELQKWTKTLAESFQLFTVWAAKMLFVSKQKKFTSVCESLFVGITRFAIFSDEDSVGGSVLELPAWVAVADCGVNRGISHDKVDECCLKELILKVEKKNDWVLFHWQCNHHDDQWAGWQFDFYDKTRDQSVGTPLAFG